MKHDYLFSKTALSFFISWFTIISGVTQNNQVNGCMDDYYASPMIEEAPRNIILQNRCGNRATLMFFEKHAEIQFVYKPNAFRRKDYRARNFSNRDNFTCLFPVFKLPQIKVDDIYQWGYDPFITTLKTKTTWEAKNKITMINLADENAFALSAKAPLLIAVKPHNAFEVSDGVLKEQFNDRGENIVSFIKFNGFEENRFRVTSDGEYILQLFENEVIIIGGEENNYQVGRVIAKYNNTTLETLAAENEKILAPKMDKGLVSFDNPDFQKVIDLNHRIVYSGIDEGGACFGALNRIYYLIWVRDGAMTSSLMARAGNPELIKIWTKFLLNNPSVLTNDKGEKIKEFQQIVGSRWTKNEDDGIYYATLSLFTYFQTTGRNDLLQGEEINILTDAIDHFIKKVWDADKKLTISDTRGETPLKSNPYFGYDVVNGNFEINDHHLNKEGKTISKSASLYNMVNTYNIMMMASALLDQRDELDNGRKKRYLQIASDIENSIRTKYVAPDGYLYSEYLQFNDGTDYWQPFAKGADYWEYSWAVSLGPFYPALDLQLKSARMVPEAWPKIRTYGYCPWNTVSRMLYEFGMRSNEYEEMLSEQIEEALMLTEKYPMPGALTEYNTAVNGWRALPFSAGSLFFTMSAQMIQSMPMGIGIRASENVDTIKNFAFRLASINAIATGSGDIVKSYTLNGNEMPYTLQVLESKLRFGVNKVRVTRGTENDQTRLYSSTAQLLDYHYNQEAIKYIFYSPIPVEMIFENIDELAVHVFDKNNEPVDYQSFKMESDHKTRLRFNTDGEFSVTIKLK